MNWFILVGLCILVLVYYKEKENVELIIKQFEVFRL